MQKNVEQALGSSSSSTTTEEGGEESVAKKLIIKDLQITDGKISYSNALLGSKPIALALPAIKMTGIGEKSGGATAGEVVNQILASINKSASGAVTNSGALKDAGDQLKKQAEEKLGGLKGLLNR